MPERDITGRVAMRVQKRIERLRARIAVKIPYGPTRSKLSPQELRIQIQNLDPSTKLRMMETAGVDEWNRMMDELYGS